MLASKSILNSSSNSLLVIGDARNNYRSINKDTKKIYGFDKFYQNEKIKKTYVKKNISNVVLTLGGTKNKNNIKFILNSINKSLKFFNITVLISNKADFLFVKKNYHYIFYLK